MSLACAPVRLADRTHAAISPVTSTATKTDESQWNPENPPRLASLAALFAVTENGVLGDASALSKDAK